MASLFRLPAIRDVTDLIYQHLFQIPLSGRPEPTNRIERGSWGPEDLCGPLRA